MPHEQRIAHAFYRKLLDLYPRTFRDQFGESMQQTFNDLWNEQNRQTRPERASFLLWMFVETATGIIREHVLLNTKGNAMKNMFITLRSPAIISLILVVPFIIMEFVNRRNFNEGFPVPLFVILWLLPLVFLLTVMPILRNVRAGNGVVANPFRLIGRVIFLALLVWLWFGIVIDQMPCFLGVANCD